MDQEKWEMIGNGDDPQTKIEKQSEELLHCIDQTSQELHEIYLSRETQKDFTDQQIQQKIDSVKTAANNIKKAYHSTKAIGDEMAGRWQDYRYRRKRPAKRPTNATVDIQENSSHHFAQGINIYKILWLCYIGSFAGVIIEMLWCFIRHGYFESRAGLVYGPFNLLYGVGATSLTLLLYRYRNRSSSISFFGGMIIGSAVEYLLSWSQETLFGSTSWDYSAVPLNINGRICLLYSVFWGLLGVMWIKSIYPRVAKVILKIPNKAGKIITILFSVFIVFDGIMSLGAVWRWSKRIENKPAASAVDKFFDNRFPDSRMEKIFANMEFDK